MAVSKQLKVFQYKDIEVQFNVKAFDGFVNRYKEKKRVTLKSIEHAIAKAVNVSDDAVRNWRFGKNGPSELDMIQGIANVLEVVDWTLLIKKYDGETTMGRMTDREKEALKRVYDSITEFLFEFLDTDGFDIVLDEVKNQGLRAFAEEMYDDIANKAKHVYRTLDKEYFDLGRHEVYSELKEYISVYVYDLFDGKIGFSENGIYVKESEVSAFEEYTRATSEINRIIEKYI